MNFTNMNILSIIKLVVRYMKTKEDLRIRKTKATLYKAYLNLIEKESYDQIKISDICKKANINRSTFYDHFKDKDELAKSLLEDTKNEMLNELKLIPPNDQYINNILDKARELITNNYIIKALLKSNPILIKQTINTILKDILKKELQKEENTPLPIEQYSLFLSEGLTALLLSKDYKKISKENLSLLISTKKQ